MTTTIEVTFENGVLHPSKPLDWKEGERHTVTVQDNVAPVILPADPPDPENVAALWEELTELAVVTGKPDFSGRDHDSILYAGPNGAL